MLQSQQKLRCLLSLALSLIGFAIALSMMVLDVNVAAKVSGSVAAFFSGWGCCYSCGRMSGDITDKAIDDYDR